MSDLDRLISAMRSSEMLRLCLVGALTVVLLIPVALIWGLVSERRDRYQATISEVSASWGNAQKITGPALVLPYLVRDTDPETGEPASTSSTRYAVFLPRRLEATGRADTESRTRGIFVVPVYTLTSSVEGAFDPPDLAGLGIDPASVLWSRAHLAVGISDVRAIGEQPALVWNEGPGEFLPGTGGFGGGEPGVHAPVMVSATDRESTFSFSLSLNGSQAVYFGPFAEETVVRLTSDSPYASFQGNWLPADREVSADGFDAVWRVSYLGRNYPQSWISTTGVGEAIEASRFGVELGNPADHYRMADRSVKYAGLFILLTFAVVWLTEVLAGSRVHPIQYLMLGAALCVFYLIELSLAEHIGFHLAYGAASLAIVAMVASYGRSIFHGGRQAALLAAGVTVLYGYLFVLLTNEDAALLAGSVGLFVVLAAIMFATRRIDWYAPARGAVSPGASAGAQGSANT